MDPEQHQTVEKVTLGNSAKETKLAFLETCLEHRQSYRELQIITLGCGEGVVCPRTLDFPLPLGSCPEKQ